MAKKLISGPILAHLYQIWAPQISLWVLPLLDARHSHHFMQFQGARMIQTQKMAKNLILGLI